MEERKNAKTEQNTNEQNTQNAMILTKHFYQYPSYKSPGISWVE